MPMRRLLVSAVVAAAAAACGPYNHDVPVEVDWTFGGKSCADAGVATIQIDVDGEILNPNQFTCAEADVGADLGTFLPGPYTVTVSGFDSSDNLVYQTTQAVQVGGRTRNVFNIDAAATTGDAALAWTFAGMSCSAAGVTSVRVSVDGNVITDTQGHPDLPCQSGGHEGTTIGPLSPGGHTFAVAASGAGDDYASGDFSVQIATGAVTPVPVDLAVAQPTTASAEVRWTFTPGGKTCADVGVDHIYVYFDPPASGSWGNAIADTACAGVGGAPVTELQIVDVPDGTHSFAVRGTKNNQILYYTHQPVSTVFGAPFNTPVDLTAEPNP
jgi:hypothetical protein